MSNPLLPTRAHRLPSDEAAHRRACGWRTAAVPAGLLLVLYALLAWRHRDDYYFDPMCSALPAHWFSGAFRAREYDHYGAGRVFLRAGGERTCFANHTDVPVVHMRRPQESGGAFWMYAMPASEVRFNTGRTRCFRSHDEFFESRLAAATDDPPVLDSVQFIANHERSRFFPLTLLFRACHNPTLTEIIDLRNSGNETCPRSRVRAYTSARTGRACRCNEHSQYLSCISL